ncbi:sterol-binding-like protein [Gonapodya prolifera JEL478]|uniref:Sterol-binding-like protein n=1 Tax=Gonapodya prolifera (strain JEL478) TaxID=1344416 RepID=A0A139ACB0_GONPJ|nr:sterol-binding-like protein [Gonapodya prolifera JEL478]|eukprot:KXS14299.1 sterol-binding-like protein [Gonapodya prolifera JEL478]
MSFKSAAQFAAMTSAFAALPDAEKAAQIKKTNAVFLFTVTSGGSAKEWLLDLKKSGTVQEVPEGGKPSVKPDINIICDDATFVDLIDGKINGQSAFMSGKIKIKGNMMLAMKLDNVIKVAKATPKPKAAAPAPAPAAALAEVPGFESSKVFAQLKAGIESLSPADQEKQVKNTKNVFQFDVKNASGTSQTWILDLKSGPTPKILTSGGPKPDITIAIADADFVNLALGKLNAQQAYMGGKLKVKGNLMAAMKLENVLKAARPAAKL